MLYLKSFLVGIVGAIVAVVLWIVVSLVLPLFVPMLIDRSSIPMLIDPIRNSGGVGFASVDSNSILLAALVGFVIAAWWAARRFRVVP